VSLKVLLACLLLAATSATAADKPVDLQRLRAGDPVATALAQLNSQGFRVVYSSALVHPDMKLRTVPSSSNIEALLREILAPWKLRAVRASNGDWLIAAEESPAASPEPAAAADREQALEVVDVMATRMRLAVGAASEVFLDRKDVERMPHLADDALRMLKVLPGVSGGDFSAALNVRGGRREEALMTIDGAEIHNAFHFRDIDGALSVLDTSLVEGIDFITGGMTADIGDYMSGAVGLLSRKPSADDEYRSGVGISFVSAFARSSGTFAHEQGSWLVSARRGFLDVLTERVVPDDEQLTPRYTDVFAAANYQFSDRTELQARFLLSDDDLTLVVDDDEIDSAGDGHSNHLWFTLRHDFPDDIHSTTLVSAATARQGRDSSGSEDKRAGEVYSENEFRFLDVRQDWSWSLDDRHMPRWGFNLGEQQGEYDYAMQATIFDPLIALVPIEKSYATNMDASLQKAGVYAAWRSRLTSQLTAEAGLRWDTYRYDGGLEFEAVSPRLNLVYSFGDNELRAAWGVLHQPQAVNELQVEDNVTQFFEPEKSTHAVIGYSRRFAHGISARVDVYAKDYENMRARYENVFDPLQLIPEGAIDRIRIDAPRARARGVELTVRREAERGLAGWLSYSYARAEDLDDGRWTPRSWEQLQTVSFGGSWTGALWNFSLVGLVHGGTPTTSLGIESTPLPGGGYAVEGVVGPRNEDNLGAYARIDLRMSRDVMLANSKLSLYVEITNLLNRENECCINDYRVEQVGSPAPVLILEKGYYLPLLPSFGFQWEF
jgi:outer membrane receptor protein involved in Fe transport